MIKEITAKELADFLGLKTDRQARNIIQSRKYKGTPLQVRQEKSLRGKPSYLVAWDVENNAPAQNPAIGEDDDDRRRDRNEKNCFTKTTSVYEKNSRDGGRTGGCETTVGEGNGSNGVNTVTAGTFTNESGHFFGEQNANSFTEKEVKNGTGDFSQKAFKKHFQCNEKNQEKNFSSAISSKNRPMVEYLPATSIGGKHAKNSSELTDLNVAPPTSHLSVESFSNESADGHFFQAEPKQLSFKQLAKNAEHNARERDNARINSLVDDYFEEKNNVLSLNPPAAVSVSHSSANKSSTAENAPQNIIGAGNAVLPATAVNQDFHPDSFDCQVHYVLRLIDINKLGKVCKSNTLKAYFSTVLIADDLRVEWNALSNNVQRAEFAEKHKLVGEIPARLKAKGNPKSLTGRKSIVPPEAVEWIKKKVQAWADDDAQILTPTRRRTDFLLMTLLKKHTGISLSEKQIFTLVKNHNLRQLMNKPQGKAGKKVFKEKGTYPRLPVNKLWLMDGCVPELMYIRGTDGRYTKLTCIGIEDVGSRMLLGFREYYSESGTSSVNLFKEVMSKNDFRKGTSKQSIKPTLRPDKGSGFMTSRVRVRSPSAKRMPRNTILRLILKKLTQAVQPKKPILNRHGNPCIQPTSG